MRRSVYSFAGVAACAVLAACSQPGVNSVPPERTIQSVYKQTASPFGYAVHPRMRRLGDLLLHNCASAGSTDCLTPTTIRSGYNFSYTPGVRDGTGQTIVIVDAYGSPTIVQDVAQFDKLFGLPDPVITPYYPGGKPSINLNNATQASWAEETSLDVEWAHAAAPGAAIALVIANNDQGSTIQATQLYAASNFPGSAMSLSFGVQELAINGGANNTQLTQAETIYRTAAANHMTVIASAGDLGATGGLASANPQYPASDPNVLSVGGTNLTLFHNGNYRNESVWDDADNCISPCLAPNDGATGGAPSTIFTNVTLPNQALMLGGKTARAVADVSYNASPNTGVVVVIGFTAHGITPGTYAVGGTSQGPPQYAGIIAIANQVRAHLNPARGPVGVVTNALYGAVLSGAQNTKTPPFHDVTIGDNKFPASGIGYAAGAGYDYPTGLGSPNINNLLGILVNLP